MDIVFIPEPEVLINAGVDPVVVDGWHYEKVEMMGEKGNPVEVNKPLKPFELT